MPVAVETRSIRTPVRAGGLLVLLGGLVAVVFLSITVGARPISPGDVWGALTAPVSDSTTQRIILELRLPRTLVGLLVGAGRAVAGVVGAGHADGGLVALRVAEGVPQRPGRQGVDAQHRAGGAVRQHPVAVGDGVHGGRGVDQAVARQDEHEGLGEAGGGAAATFVSGGAEAGGATILPKDCSFSGLAQK